MGCEALIPYQTDAGKIEEIARLLKQRFLERTLDEWFDILSKADVPVSKVKMLSELKEVPQLKYRNMIGEVDVPTGQSVKQVGISIKLSDFPGRIKNTGASQGENTREILAELGYKQDEIQNLQTEAVV